MLNRPHRQTAQKEKSFPLPHSKIKATLPWALPRWIVKLFTKRDTNDVQKQSSGEHPTEQDLRKIRSKLWSNAFDIFPNPLFGQQQK